MIFHGDVQRECRLPQECCTSPRGPLKKNARTHFCVNALCDLTPSVQRENVEVNSCGFTVGMESLLGVELFKDINQLT